VPPFSNTTPNYDISLPFVSSENIINTTIFSTQEVNFYCQGPTIEVLINNQKVSAIIDTGAVTSLIDKALVGNCLRFQNDQIKLRSVSNHQLQDEGFAIVTITIGSSDITYPFIVVDNPKIQLLLGFDFLRYFGITISTSNNVLSGASIPSTNFNSPNYDIHKKIGLSKYIKCTNNQPTIVGRKMNNEQNHCTTHQNQITMQTDFCERDEQVPTAASFRKASFRTQPKNIPEDISKNFKEEVQTMDSHYNVQVQNSMAHPLRQSDMTLKGHIGPESGPENSSMKRHPNFITSNVRAKTSPASQEGFPYEDKTQVTRSISNHVGTCKPLGTATGKFIRLAKNIQLPPRCKIQVPICKLDILDKDIAIISPNENLRRSNNIYIPHVAMTNQTAYIEVINSSHQPKFLCSSTKLGKIKTLIEEKDIIHNQKENNSLKINAGMNSTFISRDKVSTKTNIPSIKIGPDVPDDIRGKLLQLVEEYADVFATDPDKLTQARHFKFHIETGTASPVQCKPFRLSERENEVIHEKCEDLLKKKLIEPSSSPWSSNCFLVPQKNEDGGISYRMVMDYRKVNKVIRPFCYPLPKIDDILQKLKGARYISTLDLASGYHQCKLDEESKEKTAFITRDNLYQWNVMPFGIRTAPSAFSNLVALAFAGIIDEELAVYIDDICIFTKSCEAHLDKLRQVFDRLRSSRLQLKPSKCKFLFSDVRVLGYKATPNGILPTDDHIRGLTKMRSPQSKKELQKMLGFYNFFRRFIKGYASIIRPLQKLLSKEEKFKWTQEHEDIFQKLKTMLTTAPVLSHVQPDGELILRCDASIEGIGSVLLQKIDGVEKPICFLSRALNQAEKNYAIPTLETLAVVWSLQKLRPLVFQRKIKCFTDHSSLCHMAKGPKNHLPSKLARMLLSLEEYDIDFHHIAGRVNDAPDVLSRFPADKEEEENPNVVDLPLLAIGMDNIDAMQNMDSELQRLKQDVKNNIPNKHTKHMFLKDDVLFFHSPHLEHATIVLPSHLKPSVLQEMHDAPISGHLGIFKTYQKIATRFYWRKMRQEIKAYVRSCHPCQLRKNPKRKPYGLLQPMPVPEAPFTTIALDLVGPFNRSTSQMKYIITATDHATRYLECKALRNGPSEEIAKFLVENIILRHGVPHNILSDLGAAFTSDLLAEISKFMGIKQIHTTAYNPKANGACERVHDTIVNAISCYVSSGKNDWDKFLKHIQFAINSSVHEGTLFSPHYLIYAQEPTLPAEVELSLPKYCSVAELAERVKLARLLAVDRLKGQQARHAKYGNVKRMEKSFAIGDKVLVRKIVNPRGKSKKLFFNWVGPYTIIAKSPDNEVNYTIEATIGRKTHRQTIHIEKLKPYYKCSEEDANELGDMPDDSHDVSEDPDPDAEEVDPTTKNLDISSDNVTHKANSNLNAEATPFTPINLQRGKDIIICDFCDEIGHDSTACKSLVPRCNTCQGKEGHTTSECFYNQASPEQPFKINFSPNLKKLSDISTLPPSNQTTTTTPSKFELSAHPTSKQTTPNVQFPQPFPQIISDSSQTFSKSDSPVAFENIPPFPNSRYNLRDRKPIKYSK